MRSCLIRVRSFAERINPMIEIIAALAARLPDEYSWGLFQAGITILIGLLMGWRQRENARKAWGAAAPGLSKQALNLGVAELCKAVSRSELGLGRGAINLKENWWRVADFVFLFTNVMVVNTLARAAQDEGYGKFVGLTPFWAWTLQVGFFVLSLVAGIKLISATCRQQEKMARLVCDLSLKPANVSEFIQRAAMKEVECEAAVIARITPTAELKSSGFRRL